VYSVCGSSISPSRLLKQTLVINLVVRLFTRSNSLLHQNGSFVTGAPCALVVLQLKMAGSE
jgi:hypothetical protein